MAQDSCRRGLPCLVVTGCVARQGALDDLVRLLFARQEQRLKFVPLGAADAHRYGILSLFLHAVVVGRHVGLVRAHVAVKC